MKEFDAIPDQEQPPVFAPSASTREARPRRPYDAAQEAAWRDWWDNLRTEELEALSGLINIVGKERLAFRAGWLSALQSQEPTP